jgi:very-short-patch-repair endonuclease
MLLPMSGRPPLPHVASRQHGAFTREQAHAAGWSNRVLAGAIRDGVLVLRHPDVFVPAGPRTVAADDRAALLAGGPRAVLSGWSAARVHRWAWTSRQLQPACVAVPRHHHVRLSGVVVLRWWLPPEHVTRMADGVWVTRPARTLADCLRLASPDLQEDMLDHALLRRWTDVDSLREVTASLAGHPGVMLLRALLAGVDSGARSHAERLAQQVLLRTGLSGWVWNHPITLPGGGVAVIDAALPELRLAVEIDGRAHHSGPREFQRDRTRQNALVALGWTVLRFTWADLVHRPDDVVRAVLAAVTRAS